MAGPELMALGAGALNAAGTAYANYSTARMTREQMAFQREQSNTQMAFQERMSNTAYQRAFADLEKAGINPILAFNAGGASTPPGAGGAGASAPMQNIASGAISSAIEARRAFAEIDNLREQNKQIASQTRLNRDLSLAAKADALVKQTTARANQLDMPRLQAKSDFDKTAFGALPDYFDSVTSVYGRFYRALLNAMGGARTTLK